MRIYIKNGRLLNPATGQDEVTDVLVEDRHILQVGKNLVSEAEENDLQVIDASGCYVMPGLIDLHVHFRDPGQT